MFSYKSILEYIVKDTANAFIFLIWFYFITKIKTKPHEIQYTKRLITYTLF